MAKGFGSFSRGLTLKSDLCIKLGMDRDSLLAKALIVKMQVIGV